MTPETLQMMLGAGIALGSFILGMSTAAMIIANVAKEFQNDKKN